VLAEVVASYGRHLLLRTADGSLQAARPQGRSLDIVCGDQVQVQAAGNELIVDSVEPRRSVLRRSNLRGRSETLAANLTQLAVTLAPNPAPDFFLIDRYLCAAESAGISAIIIANKTDLPEAPALLAELAQFSALGYELFPTQADNAHSTAALLPAFAGHTSILVGQSGVGKSSLSRALAAEAIDVVIGALVRDEEGRHTTTATRLYTCSNGVRLMDSPGVRDFAPAIDDLTPSTLGFREIAALAPQCRFQDCSHLTEPNCAVQAAVQSAAMSPRRYESYRRLRRLFKQLWEKRPEAERAARR
jgi:ribosome biogenesis GTPase / thiamine phosphate phosphatase